MIFIRVVNTDMVTQIIQARGSCIKRTTVCPICVDFREGGKLEHLEKNPRSTGEINYEELNSHEAQTGPGLASQW